VAGGACDCCVGEGRLLFFLYGLVVAVEAGEDDDWHEEVEKVVYVDCSICVAWFLLRGDLMGCLIVNGDFVLVGVLMVLDKVLGLHNSSFIVIVQ